MLISDIKIPFEPTDSNMQNKGMLILFNLYQTWVRFRVLLNHSGADFPPPSAPLPYTSAM